MGYEFKTDINIEYPFFTEMVGRLDGTKGEDVIQWQRKVPGALS